MIKSCIKYSGLCFSILYSVIHSLNSQRPVISLHLRHSLKIHKTFSRCFLFENHALYSMVYVFLHANHLLYTMPFHATMPNYYWPSGKNYFVLCKKNLWSFRIHFYFVRIVFCFVRRIYSFKNNLWASRMCFIRIVCDR